MMNILKATIDSIWPYANCKVSYLIESEEKVKWIPILYWKLEWNMGITENGDWLIEVGENVYVLSNPKSYLHVEILLEQPLSEIYEKVDTFFETFNIKVDTYSIFPFVEIVRAVFEETSSYWMELGLGWYDELPYKKKIILKESLAKIVDRKRIPQKIRHRAMKELKKLNFNQDI